MESKLDSLKAFILSRRPTLDISINKECSSLVITKFDWDYLDCLSFQEELVDLIYQDEYKDLSVFIMTNHPSCLTLGRGLQRKVEDKVELIDFNESLESMLEIPVFRIKRGGGITFHHPGQIVIYPIINLSAHQMKVYTMMNNLLFTTSKVLGQYDIDGLDYCRDLLGMWIKDRKVASIGVQVRRFVSFHGLALNLNEDTKTQEALKIIHPCGLPGSWYTSIKSSFNIDITSEEFSRKFQVEMSSVFAKECLKKN